MNVKKTQKSKYYQIPIEKFEKDMNTNLSINKKEEILDLFINYNNLLSEGEFSYIERDLHEACKRGDLELIKIYLSETVENSSKVLQFKIDRQAKTASLLYTFKSKYSEEFIIPRTFHYESEDYLITSVNDLSQFNATKIKFEENSGVKTIYRIASEFSDLFSVPRIKEIYFPASLKELKEGWCYQADKLTKIIISPMNDRFIFKENKYLLGKSDPSNDEFDTILFARRDIKEISIPSNIKIISSNAFQFCKDLTKVEIPPNSNLQIIESNAFSDSKIKYIFIPSNVSEICNHAFHNCDNLRKVEIPPNSNLHTIESNAFSYSNIEEIDFPESLKELKEGWCYRADRLTKIIISPMNDRFIFKENKYLLGKSDPSNDEFDTILFARRDIKEISIPSNIKIISSNAFQFCKDLTKVEIPLNSNLQIIESNAFSDSKIKYIFIPSNVSKICNHAFDNCDNLRKVEIPPNSNLQMIERNAFSYSKIKAFFIPSKISEIYEYSFSNCVDFQIMEISEESELKSIPLSAFYRCQKVFIMIPSSLEIYFD